MKKKIFIVFAGIIFLYPALASVQMSSDNYRIDFDSVNVGGGYSDSASYKSESTAGEIASGPSNSAGYNLQAGYQQMNEVYVAISVTANVEMSPAIMAISGGIADGSNVITVKTDCPAGYQMSLKASASPAMSSGGMNFDDYSPQNPLVPDYNWSLGGSNSEFGFTVLGNDTVQLYKNSDSQCNQSEGSTDGSHCWYGFSGTSAIGVAQSGLPNHPSGTQTTINYRAQVKTSGFQTPGAYSAMITVTATAN